MDEHQYEALLEQFREEFPAWVTKDGRSYQYEHMSDRHLNNTINFLRRQGWAVMAESQIIALTDSMVQKVQKAATIVHPQLELLCAERARRMEAGINISDEESNRLTSAFNRRRAEVERKRALRMVRGRTRIDARDYMDPEDIYEDDEVWFDRNGIPY